MFSFSALHFNHSIWSLLRKLLLSYIIMVLVALVLVMIEGEYLSITLIETIRMSWLLLESRHKTLV